jgi:hypothetical protein
MAAEEEYDFKCAAADPSVGSGFRGYVRGFLCPFGERSDSRNAFNRYLQRLQQSFEPIPRHVHGRYPARAYGIHGHKPFPKPSAMLYHFFARERAFFAPYGIAPSASSLPAPVSGWWRGLRGALSRLSYRTIR